MYQIKREVKREVKQELKQETEPLLKENPDRYVISPIKYPDMWEFVIKHRKALWTEAEIDISNDLNDWNKLSENTKNFIKNILAFFASADGIVIENLALRFMKEIQIPEVRAFYTVQMYIELVHSITYSLLLDTYVSNSNEKNKLFKAIETIPSIKRKGNWAQKWINSTESFAIRLVAFACVEGIYFQGAFCAIFWIKERGILPGLCASNDLISRDEGMHTDWAILLYKYIQNKLDFRMIKEIIKEAVEIEESFIIDSLKCDLLGMNSKLMTEYIHFTANRLSIQLGYEEIYPNAKQPFPFMDRSCFDSKESFFEVRVTNYQMNLDSEPLVFDEQF